MLAWVAHFQKFLIPSHILRNIWVNTNSIFLETIVAQHWDILAKKLPFDGNNPLDWQGFKEALIRSYRVLIQRWLHATSSTFFLIMGLWKSMPLNFSICGPALLSFLSPLVIRWKGFLWGSKKVLEQSSRGSVRRWWSLGGPQVSHSLCSHHWRHLCSSTKGRKGTKPEFGVMQPKGHVSFGHMCGKETCRSHSRHSNFYKKEESPNEQSTKSIDKKDRGCFTCHQEGHIVHNCSQNKDSETKNSYKAKKLW